MSIEYHGTHPAWEHIYAMAEDYYRRKGNLTLVKAGTLPTREDIELGKRLKRARESAGMSRPELSDAIGVSYQTIWRWEQGMHAPNIRDGVHMAQALGIDVEDLVDEAEAAHGDDS